MEEQEDKFVVPDPVPGVFVLDPTPETESKQSKPKKNRSTKKSLAIENENRLKYLKTLLDCDSLPTQVKDVLENEKQEKGFLYQLNPEEVEQFWMELYDFVNQMMSEPMSESVGEIIIAVVSVMQQTVIFYCVKESESFTQLVELLYGIMMKKDIRHEKMQNKICELCEYWCINELTLDGEFYLNTLNFLFDLTLNVKDGNDRKAEIKRMWEMHFAVARLNLRTKSCDQIVNKLARVVASPAYLSTKEGRQFISFTLTLDTKFIKKFHQAIKDFLPSCKKTQAALYGEVYYSAWHNSSTEVRQVLETQCIQNLMMHMFMFTRKKQELSHLGQNVFAILSYLHHNRTTAQFSKVLTELYMPLMWRHLRSGNNIERCNAALVFLDAYPLEKPGAGKAEEGDFMDKQHQEMVDLLTDNCHVVRIIAIKGICRNLCYGWSTFPQETIQVLMRNLIALANDGSDSSVRRTLYDSLGALLLNQNSAAYMARILPGLRDFVHDENEKVRRSFVKLLCEIKNMPNPEYIKYWKVVPLEHLAARLELENSEVGVMLSKLLMSNIYTSDMSADRFLTKLLKFANLNPIAARKLFQFSSKVLDYKGAVRVMLLILLNLRAYVRKKLEEPPNSSVEQEENEVPGRMKRKKTHSNGPLQPIIENEQNEPEEEYEDKENSSVSSNRLSDVSVGSENKNEEEEDGYGQPGVAHALIDIVSLLWAMHSNTLTEPDKETDHDNLLGLTCLAIPQFLKYYKGTPTYFGVVHLASLVPAAKLTPHSTVCSACVSHLKQMGEMTPDAEIQVIIHALCSWNRFAEIYDVVLDWLDQGFREEGLNQSRAVSQKEELKRRKVRFVAKGGKPMLALKILDAVFSHPINSKRVFEKSYNQVYDLYTYLERVKIAVERRLLGGLPLDSPMLSDDFLVKCLHRYSKLILILHRPESQTKQENQTLIDPFDASEIFFQFLQWTTKVIRPMIPLRLEDEPDISVLFLRVILRTAANLVNLLYADKKTIIELGELIQSLLSSECSLWYVEQSMIVVKHLKDYSEALHGPEDKEQIIKTVVPSLLSQALKSLTGAKYTKEQVASTIENLYEVKVSMYEVVNCLLKMYGPQFKVLKNVLKLFTDAMVIIIKHDINQLLLIDPADKVQELPFACAVLLSVVTRANIAPVWLSTIPSSISEMYSTDSNLLAAVVSLLHTLAHSGLPLPKQELCNILREAYTTVTNYTRGSTTLANTTSDSTFTEEYIDIKKEASPILSELAIFLNCTLKQRSSEVGSVV